MQLSIEEALTHFHDRWAGTSTVVFGRGRLPDGSSSYAWLTEPVRRGPVLDLGCGDGAVLQHLQHLPVVGLDSNAAELAIARERLPHAELVEGDIRSLPFADRRFEAVVSHMALMLVPDPERVAQEVDRVLQDGGTFRCVVGARNTERPAPVAAYLEGLRTVTREHGPQIAYPDATWDEATTRERFPGWDVHVTPLPVELAIPAEEARRFLRVTYYSAGLLEGQALSELDAVIDDVVTRFAKDGVLAWSLPMLGITARKPF